MSGFRGRSRRRRQAREARGGRRDVYGARVRVVVVPHALQLAPSAAGAQAQREPAAKQGGVLGRGRRGAEGVRGVLSGLEAPPQTLASSLKRGLAWWTRAASLLPVTPGLCVRAGGLQMVLGAGMCGR